METDPLNYKQLYTLRFNIDDIQEGDQIIFYKDPPDPPNLPDGQCRKMVTDSRRWTGVSTGTLRSVATLIGSVQVHFSLIKVQTM